jgi:hypothetical protein
MITAFCFPTFGEAVIIDVAVEFADATGSDVRDEFCALAETKPARAKMNDNLNKDFMNIELLVDNYFISIEFIV